MRKCIIQCIEQRCCIFHFFIKLRTYSYPCKTVSSNAKCSISYFSIIIALYQFFDFSMGNQNSVCGQLTHTVVQNINTQSLQEMCNIPTTDNAPVDPLKKFLRSPSSFYKVKTLNNLMKNQMGEEKRSVTKHETIEEEIIDRLKTKTIRMEEQNYQVEFFHILEEEIEKIVKERTENGEELNIDSIDRQQVFKKLNVNLSNFIRIIPENASNYYSFQQIIGEGTFGKVYRVICKRTKEQRAIKVLKNKITCKQDTKFLAEFSLLSQLDHPNIVKLYEIYYFKSFYYVVMEYCKGGSIIELIKKVRHFPQTLIINIMQQLFSALAYLHQKNIVHRDIKLDNIVFLNVEDASNHNYHIKIIDFGTATRKTQTKAKLAGTKCYMAPEAFKGILHFKSDSWSCGVFLYLFFTGRFPFNGRTNPQLEAEINTKTVTFPQRQWKDVSIQAKKLILGLLQRNLEKRLSPRQALNHHWFKKYASEHETPTYSACNLQLLQKYQRGNNLIAIIQSYLSLKEINQHQRERLAVIFKKIDTNNDGTIQCNELMILYSEHFGVENKDEVKKILEKIDQNSSGKIDFNEFLVAMYTRKRLFLQKALTDAFNHYDIDHDGFLQKSELKALLEGCEREEIQYLLEELDVDGDDKVSLPEFLNYMRQFH